MFDPSNTPDAKTIEKWKKIDNHKLFDKWGVFYDILKYAKLENFKSPEDFYKYVDEKILNEKFLKNILKLYEIQVYGADHAWRIKDAVDSFDSMLKTFDDLAKRLKQAGIKVVQTKSFDDIDKNKTAEDLPGIEDTPKSNGPGNPFKDGPQPPSKSKTSSDDTELSDIAIQAMKANGVEPGDLTPDDLARLKKLKATKLDSPSLKLSNDDKAQILNTVFSNIAKRKTPPKSAFGGAIDKVKNFFKTTFGKKTMNESVNRYFN